MRISDWSSDVCSSDLAAITDVDAPQTRHRVEDAMAVAVGDIGALGMGDDPAAAECLDFRPIGLRGQMMRDVEAAQFGDVVIAGHEFAPELEVRLHLAKSRCPSALPPDHEFTEF